MSFNHLSITQRILIGINISLLAFILWPTKSTTKDDTPFYQYRYKITDTQPVNRVEASSSPKIEFANITIRINHRKYVEITDIIADQDVLNFVCHNEFLKRAHWVQSTTGLMVSTIVAQKGLESNWGKSKLTRVTKNLSNIKCHLKSCKRYNIRLKRRGQIGSSTKHCVQLWDDSSKDRFVRLDTHWQGWIEYESLLKRRYLSAGKFKTVLAQAKELKRLGWATQRNYANNLNQNAEKYNLNALQKYIDEGYTITSGGGKYILFEP